MRSVELPEAYIPTDRRLAMAQGQDLPDQAIGAALFADISGFTPLTEAMAKELGPKRGAEEVSKQLNRVFSEVVAELQRYQGSVIGFSGDAITCWLDGDNGLRAVACGLAIQDVMRQFATLTTPAGTVVTLAIKVAIAAGTVRRFRVGDPSIQYIDVLAGATLDRLATTEHHSNKGEVVISMEVAHQLGECVELKEWRAAEEGEGNFAVVAGLRVQVPANPWPEVPAGAIPEEQVRAWVLPVVYERMVGGQDQYLAELRPCVALFLRFGGINYDQDEHSFDQLDNFIRWVQGIAARRDGTLVQLTIGDKGSYLYIAFGAPLAHDDDPQRAVETALELQELPPALSYIKDLQIGITRGRMRTGPYGSPLRRTYAIMGDAVNLSARLMGRAAPGEILVSQHIADAVSDHYELRLIGPMTVKGKQTSVLVSQVLGRRSASGTSDLACFGTVLVGRETELAHMMDLLETARTGKGKILRLEGVAGVGKSHLSSALVEQALARDIRVSRGVSQGATQSTAYTPWRQVILSLLGQDTVELAHNHDADLQKSRQVEAVEQFVTQTNPDWAVRLPLLGDLLGLPIPDNATTAAFEPRLRQSALFALVADMIQTWARQQPLLILLDDVHLMDEASRSLTVALGRTLAELPVLLALVHRPPVADKPILPELDELAFHVRLTLGELTPAGVMELIEHRLHGKPDALALSLIQVETQGNPFFVQELVDALRESGNLSLRAEGKDEWVLSERIFTALEQADCLTRSGDHFVIAADAQLSSVDLGLPDSIQGIVLSRIDRLPEAPKLTLKVASVAGMTFSLDVVGIAHPLHPDDETLRVHAGILQTRDFTHAEAAQVRMYAFNHTVTRDVAYETLLFDQRQQLHFAVGEALEQVAPDAITQLAYHTYLGADWRRALLYQYAAGQQAQKLFANQEGIGHLRRALRCTENLPSEETALQRLQIHATLGELLIITSQYDPALEHLNKAREMAISLGDCDTQAHICRWLARLNELRGEFTAAFNWIREGHDSLGGRETAESAELSVMAGVLMSRQGNYDDALKQAQQSMRIAEVLNDPQVLARSYNLLGFITRLRGQSLDSIDSFQRTLNLYEQTGDLHGQAMAHNQIANASFDTGQWETAVHHYQRARDIFNQSGDVHFRIYADNNLGGIALNQGHLDEALSFYQDALSSLEKIGSSAYVMGVLHMNLGATYVRRGEVTAAQQHLAEGWRLFEAVQSRDFLPELHRHMAEAARVAGDLTQAEAESKLALSLAREMNMRGEEGIAERILGEAALAQKQAQDAEQTLNDSVCILKEVGHEFELARSRMALARVYLMLDKVDQAQEALDQSIEVFERLNATLDLQTAQDLKLAHPSRPDSEPPPIDAQDGHQD